MALCPAQCVPPLGQTDDSTVAQDFSVLVLEETVLTIMVLVSLPQHPSESYNFHQLLHNGTGTNP